MEKVIAIDVIDEVRRLCFGGALLPALFFWEFVSKHIFSGKTTFRVMSFLL